MFGAGKVFEGHFQSSEMKRVEYLLTIIMIAQHHLEY